MTRCTTAFRSTTQSAAENGCSKRARALEEMLAPRYQSYRYGHALHRRKTVKVTR